MLFVFLGWIGSDTLHFQGQLSLKDSSNFICIFIFLWSFLKLIYGVSLSSILMKFRQRNSTWSGSSRSSSVHAEKSGESLNRKGWSRSSWGFMSDDNSHLLGLARLTFQYKESTDKYMDTPMFSESLYNFLLVGFRKCAVKSEWASNPATNSRELHLILFMLDPTFPKHERALFPGIVPLSGVRSLRSRCCSIHFHSILEVYYL